MRAAAQSCVDNGHDTSPVLGGLVCWTCTNPPRAGADRGETPSDRPTTPITDTPEDFARALGITPEENPNA